MTDACCPVECPLVWAAPTESYAYLLGQYLGDGSITRGRRGVFRLTITCCSTYPDIVAECSAAMGGVFPSNVVGHRTRSGAIDVSCYSKHVTCLFPQHGPGPKHRRPMTLSDWQSRIALDTHPNLFVRGLIHSDGCRSINRVRGNGREYSYVRYLFSNRSEEIRDLFCRACDLLEVEWRQMNYCNISVARRDSVARLEEIVGPKS